MTSKEEADEARRSALAGDEDALMAAIDRMMEAHFEGYWCIRAAGCDEEDFQDAIWNDRYGNRTMIMTGAR